MTTMCSGSERCDACGRITKQPKTKLWLITPEGLALCTHCKMKPPAGRQRREVRELGITAIAYPKEEPCPTE